MSKTVLAVLFGSLLGIIAFGVHASPVGEQPTKGPAINDGPRCGPETRGCGRR